MHGGKFLSHGAGQPENLLHDGYRAVGQALFAHFVLHCIQADLVQFIYGDCDVHHLVRRSADLGEAGQDLPVIDLKRHSDIQQAENLIHYLHQFQLVQLGLGPYHVHVALVELAVAALLGTVRTPYRLDLETLEGEGNLVLMLHHEAGKGHCEVVAQALLGGLVGLFSAVLYAEQEFVALVAVFAEEGGESLHRGGFYLRISEGAENALDCIEKVIPLSHFLLREISHSLGDRRFVCHRMQS